MSEKKELQPDHFLSPDFFNDPYPYYAFLRRESPVLWNEQKRSWIVTKYSDISSGLRNPYLIVGREKRQLSDLQAMEKQQILDLSEFYKNWLLYMDPPDHTRLRKSINKALTPAYFQSRYQAISDISEMLLHKLNQKNEVDILHDYAVPISIYSILNILDLDNSYYDFVKKWSDDISGFVVGSQIGFEGALRAQRSLIEFSEIIGDILSRKNDNELTIKYALHDSIDRGLINKSEAIAIYGNILFDGHGPIANGIANGIYSLLSNPKQYEVLKNSGDINPAIEELLRFQTPFQFATRIAATDLAINDSRISKGDKILLMIGSANRDGLVFKDPEVLDINRQNGKNLTFSYGTHFCLGASFAKSVLRITVSNLNKQFNNMRLMDENVIWQSNLAVRGLVDLRVNIN